MVWRFESSSGHQFNRSAALAVWLEAESSRLGGIFLPHQLFGFPLFRGIQKLEKPEAVHAQMAELVDALGSGPSAGNGVEVRVLFWAPIHQVANALQRGLRRQTRQENSRFGGIFFAHAFLLSRQSLFSHEASPFMKPGSP